MKFPFQQPRLATLLSAILAWGLVAFAILVLQLQMDMPPCPLCVFQRLAFLAYGLLALIPVLFFWGRPAYRWLMLLPVLAAATGLGIAVRHLWLQWFPAPGMASCGPGLSYMLGHYGLPDVVMTVLAGGGNCADRHWAFLGLSIPGWSALWFLLLTLWSAGQFLGVRERPGN